MIPISVPVAVIAWLAVRLMYQNTTMTIHSVKSANVNSVQKGVERLDKGELPGCCHVCPTGAIILVHVKNYWLKLNVV